MGAKFRIGALRYAVRRLAYSFHPAPTLFHVTQRLQHLLIRQGRL
jgi:hypothetical protein